MDDIFDSLVQDIEREAYPYFYAKSEYRQQQFQSLLHMNWLKEHLSDEEMAHLEQAREAGSRVDTLEREALVRTALAAGIRLALCC
ncbi:MAG: hypothetical protein HDT38_02505 [Clostridiales bacterium]|nr:hypothetical protein [Clostridiales bacterium]